MIARPPVSCRHVDAVPAPLEGEIDAVVPHPLALQPVAQAGARQQVDRALLEHAGAHPLDDVLFRAALEDHRVDPVPVQQMPEHESGRPAADDADLGTERSERSRHRGPEGLYFERLRTRHGTRVT